MDNRLTKKRLSEFLQYEWIFILVIAIVGIIVWEFVYTVSAVRLTTGQYFKIYYDQSVSGTSSGQLNSLMDEKDAFSYDVLKVDYEELTGNMEILSARLSVQEGDVIFTDVKAPAEDAKTKVVSANTLIDSFPVYDLGHMLEDAENYLAKFLKDGVTADGAQLEFENLSSEKIENHFLTRMKKDNRFRSEEQKRVGVEQEKGRIEKLCKEVKDFKIVLSQDDSWFYKYTKYEQASINTTGVNKDEYQYAYQKEIDEGRENTRYGIRLSALKGGKRSVAEYFKLKNATDATDVVVLFFDFFEGGKKIESQPDLQFECISFFNTIVRECSDILG